MTPALDPSANNATAAPFADPRRGLNAAPDRAITLGLVLACSLPLRADDPR